MPSELRAAATGSSYSLHPGLVIQFCPCQNPGVSLPPPQRNGGVNDRFLTFINTPESSLSRPSFTLMNVLASFPPPAHYRASCLCFRNLHSRHSFKPKSVDVLPLLRGLHGSPLTGVKAKVFTVAHQGPMTSSPVPSVTPSPTLSLPAPLDAATLASLIFLKHSCPLVPQDICTGCSLYRNSLSQISSTWLPPSGLCSDGTPAPRQAFPDHFHTAPSLHSLPLFLYFLHIASSLPYFLFYYLMFYYLSPALEQKLHQGRDSSLVWFCCCFPNTKNGAWHTADAHYLSHYGWTVIKSRDVEVPLGYGCAMGLFPCSQHCHSHVPTLKACVE